MAELRVLRTAKATLSRTFYLDEVATGASGAVGVAITRLDGSPVQSGNAAADGDSYSFTFQGSDVVDELIVTWVATVGGDAITLDQDRIQVVGGFYFGLAEARNIDPVLTNTVKYPTADIVARRIEVEDECELICGQAFVPRFCREVLSGRGHVNALRLRWPNLRRVRSLTVNGTAWTQDEVDAVGADPLGLIRATGGWTWAGYSGEWPSGIGNIIVEYEHGLDTPPATIVRGAKLRMKSLLLTNKSPLPDRAERLSTTDVGTVTLAIESKDSTGIPTVDACYRKFPSPRPEFG
jgi:hypothetical protein